MIEAKGESPIPRAFLTNCGTYSWHVRKDLLQVDQTLASFLDLNTQEAEEGVPLKRYLESVHSDDREQVKAHIEQSILTGEPCRQAYRLCSTAKGTLPIVAMGQCFRDESGAPADYTGMIFEADSYGAHRNEEDVAEHCLAAFASARKSNNDVVVYLLAMVLLELGYTDAAATLQTTTH